MQVERAAFHTADIEAYGMGAGVVPLAIDPAGTYRVLLGRERFVPQWKGSCRWSGFEGSRKENECMQDAAVREFCEESLGVLTTTCGMATTLSNRNYWIRIVLKIHQERRTINRYHTTYVVPVQWDADAPHRFLRLRMNIEFIDRAVQEWCYARPMVLCDEHMDIGPIARQTLDGDEGDVVATVLRKARSGDVTVDIPPWTTIGDGVQRAILHGKAAVSCLEWERQRERVQRTLFQHPSVTVRRCASWGLLQQVTVSKDYLEKDQLRWWSIPELHQVLQDRGHFETDRFRPYFLPVLHTLLQELTLDPPAPVPGPHAVCLECVP